MCLDFYLILTGLWKRKNSKTNLNAPPYGIILTEKLIRLLNRQILTCTDL